MNELMFHEALESLWKFVRRTNKYIDETMPWVLAKDEANKDQLNHVLYNLCESIRLISTLISSLLPETARKIFDQLGIAGKEDLYDWASTDTFGLIPDGTKVEKEEVLFPRLEVEEEIKALEDLFAEKIVDQEVKLDHKEEIGIEDFEKIEEMVGKNVVVVCNLKPVKLRGVESQGMILAAGDDGDDLVIPEAIGAKDGAEVR